MITADEIKPDQNKEMDEFIEKLPQLQGNLENINVVFSSKV